MAAVPATLLAAGCGSDSGTVPRDAASELASTDLSVAKDLPVDRPLDSVVARDVPSGVDGLANPTDARGQDAIVIDAPITTDTGRGPDAAVDGAISLAQISALLAARCVGCHSGTGAAASRLNLSDSPDAGVPLRDRLIGPLVLEAFCGLGADGGAGIDAGARHAIVPGNTGESFLYLKVTGQQPSPGNPPANCGARMPRVVVPTVDGGTTQIGCDQADGGVAANCLRPQDIDIIRQWILEGAP